MRKGLVNKITKLCADNYSEETFEHCQRVSKYAMDNVCLVGDTEKEIAFVIAMCHDLLEDTHVSVEDISKASGYSEYFIKDMLGTLTKDRDETYVEYIQRLKSNRSVYPYIVKLADMKDHLTQREALTDRLKEKYWEALPYLL